jgi:hypothetical protein
MDLTPCEFRLFVHLRHCLDGRFFDDDIALEGIVSEILLPMESVMFMSVYVEWKHQLQQCVDQGGDLL